MSVRIGTSAVKISSSSVYDPIRGGQIVDVWEGDATNISAVANSLQTYERFELDGSNAPCWRLTVYSPEAAEAPVWELLANLKEKSIYEHARYQAISDTNIGALQKWLKNPVAGSAPAFTDGSTAVLATELWQLVIRGTTKYFTEDYVLRYTVTVTNAIALNLAYSSTDAIFPKSLSGSGLILPAGISASISNIPDRVAPAGFTWGFLKRAPTARQTQIGKVVITGEYWLDVWPTNIYS